MPDTMLALNASEADQQEPETASIARAEVAQTRFDPRTASLVVLAVLAVFYTLYFTSEFLLPIVFATVLNLLLKPAKRFMTNRLRFPASLAALLLIVALLLVVAVVFTAISVPAASWIGKVPQSLPTLEQRLSFLKGPIAYASHAAQQVSHAMSAEPAAGTGGQQTPIAVQSQSGLSTFGISILQGTRFAFSQLLTMIVVLFFLLAAGDTLMRRLVEILPTFGDKRRVVEIGKETAHHISSYLVLITVMNALVGLANGVSMYLLGVPDALLWGTLAFLLNYIPILGPFTGIVIFFFVGLFSSSNLWWALAPPGIYLLIHIIEGETVTPTLLARRMTLNPVLVILSLFFWDFIWGIPGAFLAVPLLAAAKIVCDHIPRLTPIGHMLGGSPE